MSDDEIQDMIEALEAGWMFRLFSEKLGRHFWLVPDGPPRRHATEPTFQLHEWVQLAKLDLEGLEWVMAAKSGLPGSNVSSEPINRSHKRPPDITPANGVPSGSNSTPHERSILPLFSQPKPRRKASTALW